MNSLSHDSSDNVCNNTHWIYIDTHSYVSDLPIIGSDNGLSPGRGQAIEPNTAYC